MNTQEFHDTIRRGLLEENTPHFDLISDEMIDDALNAVQIDHIRDEYSAPDVKHPQANLRKVSDLHTLFKTESGEISIADQPKEFVTIDLPEDMLLYMRGRVTGRRFINDLGDNISIAPPYRKMKVAIVEDDNEDSAMENPFTTSSHKRVIGVFEPNKIRLNTNKKSIVIDFSVKYICIPNKISLSLYSEDVTKGLCSLPEGVHHILVEKAIKYILEQTQSSRLQTKSSDVQQLN